MDPVVDSGFVWKDDVAGRALQSPDLASIAGHAFTTRDVSFRRERAQDEDRVSSLLGLSRDRLVQVKQVHGRAVLLVQPGKAVPAEVEADAIVSTDPARAVAVFVADCVPLLLADRDHRVVAAVHAGWRGTCAGVARAAVQAIAGLGIAPADLVAAIGPSIGPCCYQVDERVRSAFLAATPDAAAWFAEDGPGHWRLDLWRANRDQLVQSGVDDAAIHLARVCSFDREDACFSYRREGAGTGRMAAVVRLGRPRGSFRA
jgi:YfiH family protein